jgi:hypothetical protein
MFLLKEFRLVSPEATLCGRVEKLMSIVSLFFYQCEPACDFTDTSSAAIAKWRAPTLFLLQSRPPNTLARIELFSPDIGMDAAATLV